MKTSASKDGKTNAKGTRGQLQGSSVSGGYHAVPAREDSPPTLAELGIVINQLDAWSAALRAIGTNTELLIEAIYKGVEARCHAVELYDAMEDVSGKRTDVTSNTQVFEVTSPKQRARSEINSDTQVFELTAKQRERSGY